ncbi:MAG TPA: replication-relaxation family protein [Planctomycetaceae bacterium]|nr:replication-relaxation family protein [Planctomycetaceae bacterium]HQZ64530.1 replication-relaxation family protein [Planctomycetaceae bacterium]
MKLTANDVSILVAVARYYVLSAAMIHRICFPGRKDGRHTRRRLLELTQLGLLRKSAVNVAFSVGNAGPAYSPANGGVEALATYFNDDSWLSVNTRPPRLDRLYHWLDISWTHSIIHRACQQSQTTKLVQWINEWQPLRDADDNPSNFVLHTQFRESPPLSCSPDAAFLLQVGNHFRVVYVEVDRGTSGARRIAASKTPGFKEALITQNHRRHFPQTTEEDFSILLIAIDRNHRDRIQREVSQMTDKHPELWLFCSRDEFTPEAALFGNIYIDHEGTAGPLICGGAESANVSTNAAVSNTPRTLLQQEGSHVE